VRPAAGLRELALALSGRRDHGDVEVDISSYLYTLFGAEAIDHLLRVATGLDSMLIGEAEILGQVGEAIDLILDAGPAHGGPASTVVDCSGARPVILREGAIPTSRIARILDAAGMTHEVRSRQRGPTPRPST